MQGLTEDAGRKNLKLLAWRKDFVKTRTARKGAYSKQKKLIRSSLRNLSSRIAHSLRENNARKPEETLVLDCSWMNLMVDKSQFKEGMTLENYGEWHLDHVRPLELSVEEDGQPSEQCYGFQLEGYQPLGCRVSKSDNYDPADEVEWHT